MQMPTCSMTARACNYPTYAAGKGNYRLGIYSGPALGGHCDNRRRYRDFMIR